ncbi:putative peptide deformylase [Candidatus Hodgkinia cicadicola Dsem]|nr:putative peptide deformylase [Candidatus Hodgkinia cicadicola Dsem]
MFDSPCSLRKHPEPALRLALTALELALALALQHRLLALALAHNALGAACSQLGWPVAGVVLTSGRATAGRVIVGSARVRLAGCARESREACLSLTSAVSVVARSWRVCAVALAARAGALSVRGVAACCCQHELDHVVGVLIADLSGGDLRAVSFELKQLRRHVALG